MVVHLFLNNNKALDFLPINSIKNGGITAEPKYTLINDCLAGIDFFLTLIFVLPYPLVV